MKIKCDYCGNTYEDTLHACPDCSAPNPSHKNEKGPKTIEELKKWYKDRKLPAPEVTRFFIGVDYKKPKAFGIYKDDSGDFVVYKNKADGSRAVRYKGADEEYAVNELLQRLKDEIVHQKNCSGRKKSTSVTRSVPSSTSSTTKNNRSLPLMEIISISIAAFCILFGIALIMSFPDHNGYYRYGHGVYYNYDDHWFYYDTDNWVEISQNDPIPREISSNYDDYYISRNWDQSMDTTNWNDTSFYDRYHVSSDNDSDSDYDWGNNDTWDSDNTDWGSDW